MASKKTALKPDFFNNLPSLSKKEETEEVGDEEKFLYGMEQTAGWPIFTRKKDALLADLDRVLTVAIANGSSKEVIGENAILISMVKEIISRLWAFVEDSKEVCEQRTAGT